MSTLPAGWQLVNLGNIAETALGKMLDAGKPKGICATPYLRNINVQWGRIDTDDVREVAMSHDERDRFRLEAGDLLVCEGGDIGRAAVWRGNGQYMAYQKALHRVRSKGDLNLTYLRYLLEHYANTGALRSRATGSTILHLPQQKLRELPVPLPPIAEQHQIVETLESHLSRLDSGAELTTIVEIRAQSRLRSWLSKAMGDPPTREMASLGDLLVEARGGWSRGHRHEVSPQKGVPYLKMNNITRHGQLSLPKVAHVDGSEKEIARYSLLEGDVLFNSKNSSDLVGKTAVATSEVSGWTFNENIMRLRFNSDTLLPKFVGLWFQGPILRNEIRVAVRASTNVAAIYMHQLRRMSMWTPPLGRQSEILNQFELLQESTDHLSRELAKIQQQAQILRQTLLAAAFTGQLTRSGYITASTTEELARV